MTPQNPWLRFLALPDDAHTLVICVPPTGAHGATFTGWAGHLPAATALAVTDPPGRGMRIGEEPETDLAAYAAAVARGLLHLDHRLIVVGVSLGAVIAYEVCRALIGAGREVALLCSVAGLSPWSYRGRAPGTAESLTLRDARTFMTSVGLTEPELVDHHEFEEVLLPPILADLRLAAGYDGTGAPRLPVPIRTVQATGDALTPQAEVRAWARYTSRGCSEAVVEGGHYVHRTHAAQVIEACLAGTFPEGRLPRRSLLGYGAGVLGALGAGAGWPEPAAAAPASAGIGAAGVPASAFTGDPTDPVALAAAMIRFDTANPGDGATTLPHALMLREIFDDAGAATEIVTTPKAGNVHFFARIPAAGSVGKAPLLLLGHSDVVPATGDTWTVDPFGGDIRDGRLHGRGALDMKGTNAAFVAALVRHLRQGARFDREIVFWSDCDEENGPYGVSWLLNQRPDVVSPGVVLTEGGWVLNQPDGTTPMLASLTCADKRSILVQVDAEAYPTHTSKPYRGQAVTRLARALQLLDDFRAPVRPNALSRRYFDALSRSTRDKAFAAALRKMLDTTSQATRDAAGARAVQLSDYPALHEAMMRTTLAFISTTAGYYTSIIPGHASAQLRVAFFPGGDDPAETVRRLRRLIAREATLSVVGNPGETEQQTLTRVTGYLQTPPSTDDTDVFRMWQRAAARTHGGVATTVAQFEAVTSAVPFRNQGIPVYGIYPYAIGWDALKRMHGVDEYISTDALRRGTDTIYQLLAQLRVPSTEANGQTNHA